MADTWTTKTAMPTARGGGLGGTIGTDKCYVVGGYAGGAKTENEEYSQSGDSWVARTAYPSSSWPGWAHRMGGGAVIGSDTLYKLGGNGSEEYSQSGNAWTSKTNITQPRDFFPPTVGLDSDKGYVVGGYDNGYMDSNYQYSKSGNSWAAKTVLPTTVAYGHGMAIGTDRLYITGGYTGQINIQAVYEYSQSGNGWTTRNASLGISLDRYFAVAIGSSAYVIAGTVNKEYSQSGDTFTDMASPPASRWLGRGDAVGGYKGYMCGGSSYSLDTDPVSVNAQSANYEYTASDPPVYETLEDMLSFLDAQWPVGLEDFKAAVEALGWSLEDLGADIRARAYTALEDLKTEMGGNAWAFGDIKTLLDGHAQSLEDLGTDIATSNQVTYGLRCELKTRDTQGPYIFNYPNPAPGQTGVPVNTNITVILRDDGWGVDINSVWVEVDGVRYKKGDAGFGYTGSPREYTVTVDPTVDFEYNRSVSVRVFAADMAGNPGLNMVTQ